MFGRKKVSILPNFPDKTFFPKSTKKCTLTEINLSFRRKHHLRIHIFFIKNSFRKTLVKLYLSKKEINMRT